MNSSCGFGAEMAIPHIRDRSDMNSPSTQQSPVHRWLAAIGALFMLALVTSSLARADIPAAPVMTLYRFNGPVDIPYYAVEDVRGRALASGSARAAGTLAQGTTVIPCLVLDGAKPITDPGGAPLVGFTIVADARTATADSTATVRDALARQRTARVANHHCAPGVRHLLDVRNLYAMEKAPFFDPPPRGESRSAGNSTATHSPRDALIRDFHDSPQCALANTKLIGRRAALANAWASFTETQSTRWPVELLAEARDLDYALRTALYEGHIGRGCSAYGACERNIVVLSLRNRAHERCFAREGCSRSGDVTGVASKPSQYNIWDEYLTQISGLTACYLRSDLSDHPDYVRLQAMYTQSVADAETILFGSDAERLALFPGASPEGLAKTAHYYHAPAMGKCFPGHPRVEFISGAVATRGGDHALIANTRVEVGDAVSGGYRFRAVRLIEHDARDELVITDDYAGFVIDGRKIALRGGGGCRPYGIPAGCPVGDVGRHRRVPHWLDAGTPIGLTCRIAARGESCADPVRTEEIEVGGRCDTQMRPVSGVH
jgi:hypothetical protein